jgi:two-component system cell cycle sensor histidine kinase/response regulator CckA
MTKKILVLDDEELVCVVLEELLTHLGHAPTVSKSGEAALAAYGAAMATDSPFDIAILDLNLDIKGMDGGQTAKQILAIDPDATLIVSTGSSQDPIALNYSDHGFAASLCKPYRLEQLMVALNSVDLKLKLEPRKLHV